MEFEAEFARLHAELRLPGLAVGLIRGRELWWFKGYGFANLAEKTLVTRDTPFHLASLTKTYASTLLMQLVGHGEARPRHPRRRLRYRSEKSWHRHRAAPLLPNLEG